ncbi:MAG TPA: ABC transporter substrate-binding protein [Hyphomicrobiaceae bacterium]|nr:ABC transporter substrate-binding protein [Hyphomicrobiaceae bacterium]
MPLRYGLVPGLVLWLATATANAEVSELKITKQPGLLFAPMLLMEHDKLVEKHAAQAGVPGLKASWLTIMSGGANNDALLSGSVHITTSGVTNMLLLWSKTNGDVKAIIGVSGLPFKLVTRNPNIKTIKDYGPNDRIAVPTVRQSIQAITLGIALQKAYGDDKANERLVPNQVQMGHPDALTALLNPQHEVTSHFASSPFQEIELKNPGVHVVLESREALGGDGHVALAYGTTRFYEENPKTVQAFFAAYQEAVSMIRKDPKGAAESYLSMVKERASAEEIVQLLMQRGAIYQAEPVRTMVYAEYMAKAGFIKPIPKSWKDYFFPLLHDREGS